MPQFSKQTSRPLTAAGYAASVRRMRQLCDVVMSYGASPPDGMTPREKGKLTQAIHDLSRTAQSLSHRHRQMTVAGDIHAQA